MRVLAPLAGHRRCVEEVVAVVDGARNDDGGVYEEGFQKAS